MILFFVSEIGNNKGIKSIFAQIEINAQTHGDGKFDDRAFTTPMVAAPMLLGLLCFLLFEKPGKKSPKTKKGKGTKS